MVKGETMTSYRYYSPIGTFVIQQQNENSCVLTLNGCRLGNYPTPQAAATSVQRHETGLEMWDLLSNVGPEMLRDWECHAIPADSVPEINELQGMPTSMNRKRILLVDDDEAIRSLASAELADEGYQVYTAADIQAATALLEQHAFDLIVLDVHLRGENGLDFLVELSSAEPRIPVILSTAFLCYQFDYTSWLADAYVVKSSNFSYLKTEICRLMERASDL
jgi:CheY-like chemotaxis protein